MKNIFLIIIIVFILGAIAYGYNQSRSNVGDQDVHLTDDESMEVVNNQYIDYDSALLANANDGDVVLFFHAAWCPSCRTLDNGLKKELKDFPDDLTVLKVDYDKEKELKKKYSITYQHTLVQVDSQGNELAKWNGGNDLNSILKNLK